MIDALAGREVNIGRRSAPRAAALWSLVTAALLAACAGSPRAPTANTDFDARYDFSQVRRIAIQPIDRTVASAVVISDMQVERINDALIAELQRRGFQVVTDSTGADMLLSWHLVTQERTDVRSFNTATRYNCWSCGMGSNITVSQYTQGTFIVDMIDPVALRSVWRSVIESRLRAREEPEKAAEFRRAAAEAALAGFPPN